jgi:hypothetical protein
MSECSGLVKLGGSVVGRTQLVDVTTKNVIEYMYVQCTTSLGSAVSRTYDAEWRWSARLSGFANTLDV